MTPETEMKSFWRACSAAALLATGPLAGCTAKPGARAPPVEKAAAVDAQAVASEVKAAIKTLVDAYAARDPLRAAGIASDTILGMFHGGLPRIHRTQR